MMPLTNTVLAAQETQKGMENDIRKGFFTPFLGAGASSLRSGAIDPESYPWRDVAKTLTAIASWLRKSESLDFMRSFAAQRLRISREDSEKVVPALAFPDRPDLWPPMDPKLREGILVRFQVEIVRAAARLTKYFGIRFADESPSIHRLEDCSVEFRLESEAAQEPLASLLVAADIALEMRAGKVESRFLEKIPNAQRGLERQNIYEGLLTLIVGLMGTHRCDYKDQLAKHGIGSGLWRPPDGVDGGNVDDYGRLRLDAIQWMSELLWYTVRYWVPWYPTTAELAFELSLAVRGAPPRRAELAQAAQAFENESEPSDLSKIIGDLVTYCEKVQEKRDGLCRETAAFYYGIAAVLQHQFEKYKKALLREEADVLIDKYLKPQAGDAAGANGDDVESPVPVPLVFTTNFDSALESIFEAQNLPFHIVFPVLRRDKKGDDTAAATTAAPIWLIKTCRPQKNRVESVPVEWKHPNADVMPIENLEGPMIVKLHGSPGMVRTSDAVQHWVVLSEVTYLQALSNNLWVPDWLVKQLRWNSDARESSAAQRALWFLGYSISDWNVRLRLYEHCKDRGGSRRTVDRAADLYRTAILRHLKVAHCVGDLNALPYMIFRAFDDDKIAKSNAVIDLLENLKQHLVGVR